MCMVCLIYFDLLEIKFCIKIIIYRYMDKKRGYIFMKLFVDLVCGVCFI